MESRCAGEGADGGGGVLRRVVAVRRSACSRCAVHGLLVPGPRRQARNCGRLEQRAAGVGNVRGTRLPARAACRRCRSHASPLTRPRTSVSSSPLHRGRESATTRFRGGSSWPAVLVPGHTTTRCCSTPPTSPDEVSSAGLWHACYGLGEAQSAQGNGLVARFADSAWWIVRPDPRLIVPRVLRRHSMIFSARFTMDDPIDPAFTGTPSGSLLEPGRRCPATKQSRSARSIRAVGSTARCSRSTGGQRFRRPSMTVAAPARFRSPSRRPASS